MARATATHIEFIFDTDHGPENEGWYARVSLTDGQEIDCGGLDGDRRAGRPSLMPQLDSEAKLAMIAIPKNVPVQISK